MVVDIFLKMRWQNEKWNELTWASFAISDVADILSGQDIYDQERKKGNYPYITATSEQNGIGYFVGNMNCTYQIVSL